MASNGVIIVNKFVIMVIVLALIIIFVQKHDKTAELKPKQIIKDDNYEDNLILGFNDIKYDETMISYHIQPVKDKKSVLFIIKNITNKKIPLTYRSSLNYDFQVLKDNVVFWRSSYNNGVMQGALCRMETCYIEPNNDIKYTIDLNDLPENLSDDLKYKVHSAAIELREYPPLEGRLGDIFKKSIIEKMATLWRSSSPSTN